MLLKQMLLCIICLVLQSCDEGGPVDRLTPDVTVTVEDVSCTEAWLKVSVNDATPPFSVSILRNGQQVLTASFNVPETTLVDEGLAPNTPYRYTATLAGSSSNPVSGGPVDVTTMDTTSHQFQWQVDTLGATASSLYDVAIINDTLAYAVGEIYERDSAGNVDPNAYNLVKWNGQRWEFLRVQFFTFCGQPSTGSYPARAVFAFGPEDVWVGMAGSQIVRWRGDHQDPPMCTPVSINRLWGSNPNSVFAVGNGGGIAHYANGAWTRVESGTTRPIMDIRGVRIDQTGEHEVLCVAEAYGVPGGSKILSIEDNSVREMTTSGLLSWDLWRIWFVPGRKYIAVGDGLWEALSVDGPWQRNTTVPQLFKTFVDGQGLNDIIVGGAFIAHFQGVRWETLPISAGTFVSGKMQGDLVVAVGGIGNRAVVVRGRR